MLTPKFVQNEQIDKSCMFTSDVAAIRQQTGARKKGGKQNFLG